MPRSGESFCDGGPDDRVRARYWIETAFPLMQAAEIMAGEQSNRQELIHAAQIDDLCELEPALQPSLPNAFMPRRDGADSRYQRAAVTLSWPVSNMGLSLPNVLSTVAGNIFELNMFSGMRLLDIELPPSFLTRYQGPQFGVAGTRRLAGVFHRPMIGAVIKPGTGMSAQDTADLASALVEGGLDFIKDDELQADGPKCPFEQRVPSVLQVINRYAEKSGRKVMYACNITGELDEMMHRHDVTEACGGTCVMVSVNSVGLPAIAALRRYSRLAIHADRNGWGIYSRSPAVGMSYIAYQKLWRLAGADHMQVNGLENNFCEDDSTVIASARECLTPMFGAPNRSCEAMPVLFSGESVRRAPGTYQELRSSDLILVCGRGITAHPGGIAAGVRAVRQAWDATVAGVSLDQYSRDHSELQEALHPPAR
jgi:3-oxoisoapionate-4-phosphate transcarboxylase/hydrolase